MLGGVVSYQKHLDLQRHLLTPSEEEDQIDVLKRFVTDHDINLLVFGWDTGTELLARKVVQEVQDLTVMFVKPGHKPPAPPRYDPGRERMAEVPSWQRRAVSWQVAEAASIIGSPCGREERPDIP